MENAENLTELLDVLNIQWGKLSSKITEDNLAYLNNELIKLKNEIKKATSIDEINEISKRAIQSISKIEPFDFFKNIEEIDMRKGTLPEAEEDIRMKIINYCVSIEKKISEKVKERKLKS